MIRSLLVSSALAGTLCVGMQAFAAKNETSSPALAVPEVKFSGSVAGNAWFGNNRKNVLPGSMTNEAWKRQDFNRNQVFTVDDSRLKIAADGKTDRGMDYGAVMVFTADTNETNNAKEAYIFAGSDWGRTYFGDTYGVASTMSFGGFDPLGGTGGFGGGDFDHIFNYTYGALHSVDLVGDSKRATKLTYNTPRWKGFQVGGSYTPLSTHKGEANLNSRTSPDSPQKPFSRDNMANGLNYIHKFCNGLEMGLSGTSIFAKAKPEYRGAMARRNVASYAFGGSAKYGNYSFGAEYGNNGKSLQFKDVPGSNAGQFIDFGLAYTWGATKFSTGYYYAWRKARVSASTNPESPNVMKLTNHVKAKTNTVSAAIDEKLAPGFGVYIEGQFINMKNPAATSEWARDNANISASKGFIKGPVRNNTAKALVLGSRVVF